MSMTHVIDCYWIWNSKKTLSSLRKSNKVRILTHENTLKKTGIYHISWILMTSRVVHKTFQDMRPMIRVVPRIYIYVYVYTTQRESVSQYDARQTMTINIRIQRILNFTMIKYVSAQRITSTSTTCRHMICVFDYLPCPESAWMSLSDTYTTTTPFRRIDLREQKGIVSRFCPEASKRL